MIKRHIVFYQPVPQKDPVLAPIIYIETPSDNITRVIRRTCQVTRFRDEHRQFAAASHLLYFLGKESLGQDARTYSEVRCVPAVYHSKVKFMCTHEKEQAYYQKCLSIVMPYFNNVKMLAVNVESHEIKEIN